MSTMSTNVNVVTKEQVATLWNDYMTNNQDWLIDVEKAKVVASLSNLLATFPGS
jgi:hypothetical protein